MAKNNPKKLDREARKEAKTARKEAEALQLQERQDALLAKYVAAQRAKVKAESFLDSARNAQDPEVIHSATEQMLTATERMKALRKEWNQEFKRGEFDEKLSDYEARVGTGEAAAEIIGSDATTEEKVAALRDVVEDSAETREVVGILQEMNDYKVSPADLVSMDENKRNTAIRIAFSAEAATELINNLSLPEDTKEYRAAHTTLEEKRRELKPLYDQSMELIGDLNEFDEQQETKFAKEVLGKLGNSFAEKPMETTIATAAVLGALIAGITIFTKKDGLARKIMLGAAVGGAALYGINFLSGSLSDDGKTIAQRLLYDADNWQLDNLSSRFKNQLSGLTGGNEHAFQAMMHLNDTKASTIASAFENSLHGDPAQREIDPMTFFSTREIPRSEVNKINPRGLYEGIEALMIKTAINAGESRSEDRDFLAKRGLELFKEKYNSGSDDIRLQYIVCDLILGVDLPKDRNNDGSIRKGASTGSEGVERISGSVSENREAQELEDVFEGFGVNIDVVHDGETYRFMGYPLDVEVEEVGGYKVYSIGIKAIGSEEWTWGPKLIRKDAPSKDEAEAIKEYVVKAVTSDFEADNAPYTVEYNNVDHQWEVANVPVSGGISNIIKGEMQPNIIVVPGKNGFMQIRLESNDMNYASVKEAVAQSEKEIVHEKMEQDLAYILGDMSFEIENLTEAPTGTQVSISYFDKRGVITYKDGLIRNVDLEFSPDLLREWRSYGEGKAEDFMRSTAVAEAFGSLDAAFATHFQDSSLWERAKEVAARVDSRSGNEAPLFYDREEDWSEATQQKRRELQVMIASGIVDALHDNPTPEQFQKRYDKIMADIATEIGKLQGQADYISRSTLKGEDLHRELLDQTVWLNEFGYNSYAFKDFMDNVEEAMTKSGNDYPGLDGWSNARQVRDHIRLTLMEKAFPISGMDDAKVAATANVLTYLDAVIAQLPNRLSVALKDERGNFLGFDQRINIASVDAALERIPTYQEWDVKGAAYFRPGSIPRTIQTGPSSGPGSGPGGGPSSRPRALQEETEKALVKIEKAKMPAEKMQLAQDEIDRLMDPIDDLEWSVFADNFDTFLGYRKKLVVTQMRNGITKNPAMADLLATTAVLQIEKEVEALKSFTSLEQTNNSVVLRQVMEEMTDFMVSGTIWKEPSKKVLQWLTGNFEFEKVALRDEPAIFTDILDIYYNNIGFGTATHPPSPLLFTNQYMADEYTNYFLYSAAKLLPDDKNWSINNLSQIKRQVSATEWKNLVIAMKGIDTYEEWVVKGYKDRIRPELVENDTVLKIEEGVERDKAEVREEFMDWYDDNMDLGQLMRFDGNWPSLFREHAVERMLLEIDANATTSEQLKRDLNNFAKFLVIEKQFYEHIINAKVTDSSREYLPLVSFLGAAGGGMLGASGFAAGPLGFLTMPAGALGGGALLASFQHGGQRQWLGPNAGFNTGIKFHVHVRNIVQQAFVSEWAGAKDPAAYAATLQAKLKEIIRQAEEQDGSTYSLGPMAIGGFQGMDPFQVIP